MSVTLEFTVEEEQFTLGRVASGVPPTRIELERVVPTRKRVMPFLWVEGADFDVFEEGVASHPAVAEIVALDRVDDSVLYRLEWRGEEDDLIQGINDTEATVLDAHTNAGSWVFRLRFLDHDKLSRFYNYCTDREIRIHIDRTYTTTGRRGSGYRLHLSQEQREALLLGLRRGYFDTPSEVTTAELAEELGISQQAVSDRIRRGTKDVLSTVLLSRAADFD